MTRCPRCRTGRRRHLDGGTTATRGGWNGNMKISDLTNTYLWEPQSSSVSGLGCNRVPKPVSTQPSPGSSGGLPLKHHCGSGWRFGDICLAVYASFCDGNGVEVWVGLCFWTLTRTSAQGRKWSLLWSVLDISSHVYCCGLAVSHTIRPLLR